MADFEQRDQGQNAGTGNAGPEHFDPENFGKELRDHIVDRSTRWQRRREHRSGFAGAVVGLAVVTLGVLLLLQNLGIAQFEHIGDYWPLILIVLGTARAIGACSLRGRVWGGVVAGSGVLFLLHNLGYVQGNVWRMFWPLILIGVGLVMLVGAVERRGLGPRRDWGGGNPSAFTSRTGTANRLNEWATFGGVRRRIDTQEFEGGEANATFGGVELDLRNAGTKLDEITIEANAVFGGVEMRVPDTWEVSVRGSGIFGGYEDQTSEPRVMPTGKRPRLIITGYAVFGGVSVKN